MEDIQSADVQKGNSREIPEGSGDAIVISVDNKRSLPHDMSPVPDLADTSPHLEERGFSLMIVVVGGGGVCVRMFLIPNFSFRFLF